MSLPLSTVEHKRAMREYRRLRALGWRAQEALRAARTNAEFFWSECDEHDTPQIGSVRLRVEQDDFADVDYLIGDGATDAERAALIERIQRDGATGIIGEYWDGETWQHADSVWGFIGDDWRDSGYDADVRRSTLRAATQCLNAALLQGAV